jgi:hypothetical protein
MLSDIYLQLDHIRVMTERRSIKMLIGEQRDGRKLHFPGDETCPASFPAGRDRDEVAAKRFPSCDVVVDVGKDGWDDYKPLAGGDHQL